jgi:hypothetical protein
VAAELFGGIDFAGASFWAGLQPMTPGPSTTTTWASRAMRTACSDPVQENVRIPRRIINNHCPSDNNHCRWH